jgi:hypothetical protein
MQLMACLHIFQLLQLDQGCAMRGIPRGEWERIPKSPDSVERLHSANCNVHRVFVAMDTFFPWQWVQVLR